MLAISPTSAPTKSQANKRIGLEGIQSHAAEPRTAARSPTHPQTNMLKTSKTLPSTPTRGNPEGRMQLAPMLPCLWAYEPLSPLYHPVLLGPLVRMTAGQARHVLPPLSVRHRQVVNATRHTRSPAQHLGGLPSIVSTTHIFTRQMGGMSEMLNQPPMMTSIHRSRTRHDSIQVRT